MSIEAWMGFVIASSVLLIIPGPTILTVISYSISHGYKAKIPLIIAVALEDSTACLFYTSPSPRDKRQSRMPSSA